MKGLYRILFLLGASHFPLIHLYVPNRGFLKEGGFFIASLLITSITITFYYFVSRKTQKHNNSALLCGILMLGFLIYGHVYYSITDGLRIPYENLKHRYFLPLYLLLLSIPTYLLLTRKESSKNIIMIGAIIFSLLCLQHVPAWMHHEQNSSKNTAAQNFKGKKLHTPDIFYIILDSYSNNQNLQKYYHFDNSEFTTSLVKEGFHLIDSARSNYPYTYFSLSSSLNMRYINDIEDSSKLSHYTSDYPFSLIHKNAVVKYLQSKGYSYVLSQSVYGQLNDENTSDIFIGNSTTLNQYHQSLLSLSLLSAFNIGKIYQNKIYESSRQTWENWKKILEIKHSKFVFFHSLAPHPPLVFKKDGAYNSKSSPLNNRYQDKSAYVEQLQYINTEILKVVEQIKNKTNGNAIIIIQGDHGTCSSAEFEDELRWPLQPQKTLLEERYGILNAIYIPPNIAVKIPADLTPVNTFKTIFNATFNDTLPLQENHYYYGRYRPPYQFEEVFLK